MSLEDKFIFGQWFKSGKKNSAQYRILSGKENEFEVTISNEKDSINVKFNSKSFDEFNQNILNWIKTWW